MKWQIFPTPKQGDLAYSPGRAHPSQKTRRHGRCGHTDCYSFCSCPESGGPVQSLASYPISRSTVPVEAPERTVLYVEDHVVNVLLMQALFAKRPAVRLEVASTAELGLRAAADHRPDLLLLDLRLPDCHGSELLQRMRALPG